MKLYKKRMTDMFIMDSTKDNASTETLYTIELWVSNQLAGANGDGTADYLRVAEADEIAAYSSDGKVTLNGNTLSSDQPEQLWRAFRAIAAAVTDAGHGDDTEDEPAPELTARMPGAVDAAGQLQEMCSVTARSWEQWVEEANIRDVAQAHALINRSVDRNEIAHSEYDAEIAAQLEALSEYGGTWNDSVTEYWGVTDDGDEWRVHLDHTETTQTMD